MTSFDITMALGHVGTDEDLGVALVAALGAKRFEAVVAHDLVGGAPSRSI